MAVIPGRSLLARAAWLVALCLSACAGDEEPEEPDDGGYADVMQMGNPVTTDASAQADAGALPDAGRSAPSSDASSPGLDATTSAPDSGVPGPDAGGVDAGRADAAAPADSGVRADGGGGGGDAGGGACATLTYQSFGQQFMQSYCVRCHAGARAPKSILLDTLANVQKNKVAVRAQAVARTAMPESDPRPSAADRMKLGQWLDCGPN